MPKHITHLIILMCALAFIGFAMRLIFKVESFGVYGHYRANAVTEIAAGKPVFKGAAYCQQCHMQRHSEWTTGNHKGVICENCHGAAGDHPASSNIAIPKDTPRLCSRCHEAMPARRATQPQIVLSDHAGETSCILCHNPHSPKIGNTAGPAT